MATKTWTGSVSTDWNTAGNWSPPGVPASADDVVIGTTANSPTLSVSGTTVNSMTISGTDTLTLDPVISPGLTVTNGITLSSTGGISGGGNLVAAVTATGAAHITGAFSRTIAVDGTITDSGGALVLDTNGGTLWPTATAFAPTGNNLHWCATLNSAF